MLTKIKDKNVRNIVRGAIQAPSPSVLKATLDKLRLTATANDTYLAYDYLYDNPLYNESILPDAFPSSPSSFEQNVYFEPINFIKELSYHKVYFDRNLSELTNALTQLKLINEFIFKGDVSGVGQALMAFNEAFGFSLTFLKKLVSVKHLNFQDDELSEIIQSYLKEFLHPHRNIAAKAFEDSVDAHIDYIKVRRTFISYIENNKNLTNSNKIALEDYFNPLFTSSDSAAQRVQALGCFSCLDVLIFLISNEEQFKKVLHPNEYIAYEGAVPQELWEYYHELFDAFEIGNISDYLDSSDRFKEFSFFQHSANFNEIPVVYNYRLNVEMLIGNRIGSVSGVLNGDISSVAMNIQPIEIESFIEAKCSDPLDISSINPKVCGNFHRTIYLAWLVQNKTLVTQLNGHDFLKLLNITVDVANILTPTEIKTYFPNPKKNLLHECLSSALINDSVNSDRAEHKLRRSFQDLVIKDFNADVLSFIEYLYENAKHVSQYFFHVSTEVFLTKLYHIFKSNNDVIEARCDLLAWYAENFDEPDAYTRAQSLRLDLKLQNVRDDIDDNRIIVDQARFFNWMSENILSDLREIVSSSINEEHYESSIEGDFTNPVSVIQNPNLKLASIINQCFQEFCSNKNYGVESYIGRRIRHGSLEGVMLSDVQELIDEQSCRYPDDQIFINSLDGWLSRYKQAIRHIGVDLLHLQSKSKKKGRIIPNVTASNKRNILKNCLSEIEKHLLNNDSVKSLDYIYEYCWMFLETDLNNLREELTVIRSPLIMEGNKNKSEDRLRFFVNINNLIEAKFEKLSIWLQKPNNISPTTELSLLFEAVVQEIKEHDSSFVPEIVMEGDVDINLYGHGYHFFYDIIEILVKNAAQHGLDSGKITFSFDTDDSGFSTLKLESEIESKAGLVERIDKFFEEDVADAMSKTRNSGIKKLRLLQRDVKEIHDIRYDITDKTITAIVEFNLQRN